MAEKIDTVIENYEKRGFLDKVKSRFSAEDRRRVGLRLQNDFYLAGLDTTRSIDYEKPRVDSSGKDISGATLDARDRFNKAARAIPSEFWRVVSTVCCHNQLIKGRGLTKQQRLYDRYMQICDLCRGLDYLIKFYLGIGKKA